MQWIVGRHADAAGFDVSTHTKDLGSVAASHIPEHDSTNRNPAESVWNASAACICVCVEEEEEAARAWWRIGRGGSELAAKPAERQHHEDGRGEKQQIISVVFAWWVQCEAFRLRRKFLMFRVYSLLKHNREQAVKMRSKNRGHGFVTQVEITR